MNRTPTHPLRLSIAATALAGLALVAACDKQAGKADTKAPTKDASASGATKYPGLPTEKEQVSYMIGMGMGKQLAQAKAEIDVDTIAKALKASLAGEKLLLNDEQAQQIGQAFGQKMQLKMQQEMVAKAKKNAADGAAFLAANGKKPGIQTTADGLQYQVVTQGKGPRPKADEVASVHYRDRPSTARCSTTPTTAASRRHSRSTRWCRACARRSS